MNHVGHDAINHPQDGCGVMRSGAALHRRSGVHVVLHVIVVVADVDLVPWDVGVAEHDDVGVGEPTAQTGGSACCGAAVVNDRDVASVEIDDEALGKDHAAVVVPQHGMDGCELPQRRQHRTVGDVAGVDDHVGRLQVSAQTVDEPGFLALAQVGVRQQQHVHSGAHRRRLRRSPHRSPRLSSTR